MKRTGVLHRIWDLYYDGFTHMKLGKTLWLIIAIKIFIIFFILRLFFFNDFLNTKVHDGDKATYVSNQLINRVKH
jgi:hypothetical protein